MKERTPVNGDRADFARRTSQRRDNDLDALVPQDHGLYHPHMHREKRILSRNVQHPEPRELLGQPPKSACQVAILGQHQNHSISRTALHITSDRTKRYRATVLPVGYTKTRIDLENLDTGASLVEKQTSFCLSRCLHHS